MTSTASSSVGADGFARRSSVEDRKVQFEALIRRQISTQGIPKQTPTAPIPPPKPRRTFAHDVYLESKDTKPTPDRPHMVLDRPHLVVDRPHLVVSRPTVVRPSKRPQKPPPPPPPSTPSPTAERRVVSERGADEHFYVALENEKQKPKKGIASVSTKPKIAERKLKNAQEDGDGE